MNLNLIVIVIVTVVGVVMGIESEFDVVVVDLLENIE
mgnify:CR=1 FL=1